MLSRRQFLGRAAGASFLSIPGLAMPPLFARAAEQAARTDRNDHILVVVELNGGNDGLNTLVPFENALYYKYRPTIGIPKNQVIKLSDQVGLPAGMAKAAELFKEGKLAIVQGVGYPKPDRSHFRSMEIWHTASTAAQAPDTGWLGRVLDYQARPGDKALHGLSVTGSLPQAFWARQGPVPVIQDLDSLKNGLNLTPQQHLVRRLSTPPASAADPLAFLHDQVATTYAVQAQLKEAAVKYHSNVEYPGAMGQQLRQTAMAIISNPGIRLVFTNHGSYDTHSQQAGYQQRLLAELANALAAFLSDLEQHRMADRVLVLVFSEFGRRVRENASAGTDHGAASCMFLAGARVRGGLAGKYPSLEKLDDGDLMYQVDFRSVYATILEKWLGCPAEKLLGGKYPLLNLIRA
jgi:uncharacterized protein (DUF1501 family)